ncbi:MAG: M48 family metalloprotease, partial [Rhodospirillaceae bacterium]|nr:M48 family metalloprotease [Rhodospirillaceae bacterium]
MTGLRANLKRCLVAMVLLSLPGVLGACTVNPATGKQSFTAFMSPEKEKEVGRLEHVKIVKQFGGVYDEDELGAYVAIVGAKLSRYAELPDLSYTFTVLNDEKVNAFALPGGYVYITRGLLALVASEAEMAGVLAHEIGHVTARHTAQRYSATMATNIGLQVLGVIGSALGAPTGTGTLASFGAQAALQSYSREQELESDMLGVRYLARAGYDTNAMTGFFHKLQAHTRLMATMEGRDGGEQHSIMSTHPLTSERITAAKQQVAMVQASGNKQGARAYDDMIDGLLFGDDPKQGIRKGRVFEHPDLGIRFEVPSGFTMLNSSTQLLARNNDGVEIIFTMANADTFLKAGDVSKYLAAIRIDGTRFSGIETLDVNGMDAATGNTRVTKNGQSRDARLVVIREDNERAYQLLFLTPPKMAASMSTDLRRTTYSFRKMTRAEREAIKPLRIRLRTVKPGDTVESIS